jgi:hypothetical protein
MKYKEMEQLAKSDFKDHVAKYADQGDMKRLEWNKPGTRMFGMDVIFHGNFVIICGDLGEAVYECTWKTSLKSCADNNFSYFLGKLRTVSYGKHKWDQDDCNEDIEEWKKDRISEIKEEIEEYPGDKEHYEKKIAAINEFVDCAQTDFKERWINYVADQDLDKLGEDCDTELFKAGERLNSRLYLYHIALKMAWEQIEKEAI